MSMIVAGTYVVAGRFVTFEEAERALQRVRKAGFRDEDLEVFYINPAGQHARFPIGGDVAADAGARGAGRGAWRGVALGGTAGAVLGVGAIVSLGSGSLIVLMLATGVGAYLGSLMGALGSMRPAREARSVDGPESPQAGVVLAVRVDSSDLGRTKQLLEDGGAREVEQTSVRADREEPAAARSARTP
ncbi:hypothetical protein [Cupriavidus malaysiensis]|uniref:hypothetical protein n=1 Tax=Cupriavidus malaysiensis TaxID=367825 RepID=UPI000A032CBF|nr:hypothetical protein [Cupriavidus malaysiensis]